MRQYTGVPIDPIVESLDKVPEALRGEYEPRDGKFALKLTGAPAGFVEAAKLDEFRSNNRSLFTKNEELARQLEDFKGLDPAKAREALAELQKLGDRKMLDEGKIDELVAQKVGRRESEWKTREAELSDAVTQRDKANAELQRELSAVLINGAIDQAALALDVLPASLRMVRLLAEHGDDSGIRWQLGANRKPEAVQADGQPAYSKKDPTKRLDEAEWLEGIIAANPQIQRPSTGAGGMGSGAASVGGRRIDPNLPAAERLRIARRGAA